MSGFWTKRGRAGRPYNGKARDILLVPVRRSRNMISDIIAGRPRVCIAPPYQSFGAVTLDLKADIEMISVDLLVGS